MKIIILKYHKLSSLSRKHLKVWCLVRTGFLAGRWVFSSNLVAGYGGACLSRQHWWRGSRTEAEAGALLQV